MLSTKISGLAVDTDYSFYLVLRTSGGTFTSNVLNVKTQKMTDLTGITITAGVLPSQLRESLAVAVERIGAKLIDTVRIDTTHFVCTEGRGKDWEKAVEMSIPVVRPEWIEGCEREGKIIGVRDYYLDANPKHRKVGSNPTLNPPQPQNVRTTSQTSIPTRTSSVRTPDPEAAVQGEPGPTVPPTPKEKELPLPPTPKEDEANERTESASTQGEANGKEDDDEETEEEDDNEDLGEKPSKPIGNPEGNRSDANGDMEEVAL